MLHVLARHAHAAKFFLNENSTTLLTGAATAGTVVTAITTGQASFKAARLIAAEENFVNNAVGEGGSDVPTQHELSGRDKTKLVWKLYALPVATGAGTVTCIILANRISAKRIAALTVSAGISERALREYKEKVVEKFSDRKDREIRDEIAQDRVTAHPPTSSEVMITGDGKVLCYDTMTGRYFRSTVEDIKRAENTVNFQINQQLGVSFSNFCEEIGLDPTTYTDSVGWNINNLLEVQFSSAITPDNQPCLAVSFARAPSPDYDNAWT